MKNNLIFDVGMHRGEDTGFYLKKGFNVIGVEANAELCKAVAAKFSAETKDGRLRIINKAIAKTPGRVKLFINTEFTEWTTLDPQWADRNLRMGSTSVESEIEAVTLASLIEEFGTPHYVKIDIEGNDLIALESLGALAERPKYVSIESDKVSFRVLRQEMSTFTALGYDRFKIVNQAAIVPFGSSGPFGEDLPGHWLTADQTIEAYRPIFLRYALVGDDPLITNRLARGLVSRLFGPAAWHDTHARRSQDG